MNYIKQTQTQILLLSLLLLSMIFILYPNLDIQISSMFFDHGFYLKGSWWERLLYKSVQPFLIISVIAIVVLLLCNKCMQKDILAIDGKKTMFLILVLILGSGLIVNVVLKNHFGRARPVDIVEFGGTKIFTPAFVISHECDKNCSFSSGHGSAAFFSLALAMLFRNKKRALAIAFIYGSLVSLARIAAGGHFFSDNVVSFYIMLLTTDFLNYLFFMHPKYSEMVYA